MRIQLLTQQLTCSLASESSMLSVRRSSICCRAFISTTRSYCVDCVCVHTHRDVHTHSHTHTHTHTHTTTPSHTTCLYTDTHTDTPTHTHSHTCPHHLSHLHSIHLLPNARARTASTESIRIYTYTHQPRQFTGHYGCFFAVQQTDRVLSSINLCDAKRTQPHSTGLREQ